MQKITEQKVTEQKVRLEQKKNRLVAEEIKLRLKERKMRTRHLIEVGGLVTKACLDNLPTNTLYGAFLFLASSLESNHAIKDEWAKLGKATLDQEQTTKQAVILKFEQKPSSEIRQTIRGYGLKWNQLREEWYGYVVDIHTLKSDLGTIEYKIEII